MSSYSINKKNEILEKVQRLKQELKDKQKDFRTVKDKLLKYKLNNKTYIELNLRLQLENSQYKEIIEKLLKFLPEDKIINLSEQDEDYDNLLKRNLLLSKKDF
jgi:hypothetical protein